MARLNSTLSRWSKWRRLASPVRLSLNASNCSDALVASSALCASRNASCRRSCSINWPITRVPSNTRIAIRNRVPAPLM